MKTLVGKKRVDRIAPIPKVPDAGNSISHNIFSPPFKKPHTFCVLN
ncbi:MAG TPA: hypothetical protein VEG44_07705 [Candidatus Acidoferrales bacterium]|nr:hypothetical protein [Candidatus Acidoferrales bacterium]